MTVLSGDLSAAIGELRAKPDSELQVHGSGALTRCLLENDLVDEMNLLTVPVILIGDHDVHTVRPHHVCWTGSVVRDALRYTIADPRFSF